MNLKELQELVEDLIDEATSKGLEPQDLAVKIVTQPNHPLKGRLDDIGGINSKGEIILGCLQRNEYATKEDEELLNW